MSVSVVKPAVAARVVPTTRPLFVVELRRHGAGHPLVIRPVRPV